MQERIKKIIPIELTVVEFEGKQMFSCVGKKEGHIAYLFDSISSPFFISYDQFISGHPQPFGTFTIIRDGTVISNNGQLIPDPHLTTAFSGVNKNRCYAEERILATEFQTGDKLTFETVGYSGNDSFLNNLGNFFRYAKEVIQTPFIPQILIERKP